MHDEPIFEDLEPQPPVTSNERIKNWSLKKRVLLAFLLLLAAEAIAFGANFFVLLMLAFSSDGCSGVPRNLEYYVFFLPSFILAGAATLPAVFLVYASSLKWILGSIIGCGLFAMVWLIGGIVVIINVCQ